MNTTKKGIIYKLFHKTREDTPIYIGMTTKGLEKRFRDHRYSCLNSKQKKYNFYVYQFIREFGGIENWDAIKLKDFEYETHADKKKIEREYIDNAKQLGIKVLNKNIPNRSVKEWIKDNPQKWYNAQVRSRLKHREKHNTWRKDYYLKHKEQMSKHSRQYYLDNKERIDKERNMKIGCPCGAIVAKRNFKHHKSTPKHNRDLKINLIEGRRALKSSFNSCIPCDK